VRPVGRVAELDAFDRTCMRIERPILRINGEDYSQYLIVALMVACFIVLCDPKAVPIRLFGVVFRFRPEPGSLWLWITRVMALMCLVALGWMLTHDGPFTF
jgi:hypothetical protein